MNSAMQEQTMRMDVKRAYFETAEEAEKRGWEIGSLVSFYRKWNKIPARKMRNVLRSAHK